MNYSTRPMTVRHDCRAETEEAGDGPDRRGIVEIWERCTTCYREIPGTRVVDSVLVVL